MEMLIAMVSFLALIGSWFVLPATPKVVPARMTATREAMPSAA